MRIVIAGVVTWVLSVVGLGLVNAWVEQDICGFREGIRLGLGLTAVFTLLGLVLIMWAWAT